MGGRAGGGARGGFKIGPNGEITIPTHNGTSESIQKMFDKVYQQNLKTHGNAAFAKRLTLSSINSYYGTDFKLPLVAPVKAVLSSTNKKGKGVSIMMPF